MITIEKAEVFGWDAAIRGMRNPKNSWHLSDSYATKEGYVVGENDYKLMKNLASAGTDHGKFLRMITVYTDIVAPFYWWKEFSTYKVGTVANSCSTMHKIHAKEFNIGDFSTEHLNGDTKSLLEYHIIPTLNKYRRLFNANGLKEDWLQMIQLLPTSYNQKRTVMLNYQVLKNMYHARKNHKLDEWKVFCKWVESLPYSELIIGEVE